MEGSRGGGVKGIEGLIIIITACKRCLGQGSAFTPVYQSLCSQEVSASGSGGGCVALGLGGVHPLDTDTHTLVEMAIEADGTHSTGMHSCLLHHFTLPELLLYIRSVKYT